MGRRASALEAADRLIGKNIRLQRLIKEALRTALASSVGVGEQQLQKYVTRRDRVSASRLFHISRVRGVPVSSLFAGLDAIA